MRNGLIFAGIGGWMFGCGVLWQRGNLPSPTRLGWSFIVPGSLWVVLGIMSWGLIGSTGQLADLPPLLHMAFQWLFVVALLVYVVWAVGFGFWLSDTRQDQRIS